MEKNLDYQLYVQRESNFYHEPYEHEQFIYNAIKSGDTYTIIENQRLYGKCELDGKGTLSDNVFRNQLYHMIINTAIITRICMNEGLPHEAAYTLSDLYIRKADKCTTPQQIMALNDAMTIDFAEQMNFLKHSKKLSSSVRKTLDFICDNLHRKINVNELAKNIGYNRSYFSILFTKEVGMPIADYIRRKRLETAKNMLLSSDYCCSEIANTLCFSSQSHFCKLFREYYGISPKAFKKDNA